VKGESCISAEDFAVAILDEVENPKFIRKRFTVAY
jgi:putative NADH-flavin reductase